jgi:hypothetical protein
MNRAADGQALEVDLGAAADDDFVGAELEHPAFDDGELVPDRRGLRFDAAHRTLAGELVPIFGMSMIT